MSGLEIEIIDHKSTWKCSFTDLPIDKAISKELVGYLHIEDVEDDEQPSRNKHLKPRLLQWLHNKPTHLDTPDYLDQGECAEERMEDGETEENYHVKIVDRFGKDVPPHIRELVVLLPFCFEFVEF